MNQVSSVPSVHCQLHHRHRSMRSVAPMMAIALLSSGCNYRQGGAWIGGFAGLMSSEDPAIGCLGAVAGGVLGYLIGSKMDEYTTQKQQGKALKAAQSSRPAIWVSSKDQSYIRYTPGPVTQDSFGRKSRPIYGKGLDAQGKVIDVVLHAHQNSCGRWVLDQAAQPSDPMESTP